jgi:hypothetical protein
MDSTTSLQKYNIKKINKTDRPRLMLVGSFDDLFLEALMELGFDFKVNKSSKPTASDDYDLVVIDYDRSDQALDYVQKYAAIPVLSVENKRFKVDFFENYDPITEQGNAFLYTKNTTWHLLDAVLRAAETFKFKYDWKNILKEVQDVAKFAKKNIY